MKNKIIEALSSGPASAQTVGAFIGMSASTATVRMMEMIEDGKLVIHDPGRKGGSQHPRTYALASGRKVQRVSFLSSETRQWAGA